MPLPRSHSKETLATLVDDADSSDDVVLVLTGASDDTVMPGARLFGVPLGSYRRVRELPIIANFSSVHLYKSLNDLDTPILTASTSVMGLFRKSLPIVTIHLPDKTEFCKVYYHIIANNLTCHVFKFTTLNETLVVYNNGVKPSSDFSWKHLKLRVSGTTGTASAFGSDLIKIHILKQSAVGLADNLVVEPTHFVPSLKGFKVALDPDNQLYTAVKKQDKSGVNRFINPASLLFDIPFASCINNTKKLLAKGDAFIRLVEPADGDNLSTDSLVLCCIFLVLREQEVKKMKGSRPTYTA